MVVCIAFPHTLPRVQDIGIGPSLLVAFLAGCGNVLLTNPIWTVATRMQAQPPLQLPINTPELMGQARDVYSPHCCCQQTHSIVREYECGPCLSRHLACAATWPCSACRMLRRRPWACLRADQVLRRNLKGETAAAQAHRKQGDTDGAGLPPGVLTVCRDIYQEGGLQVRRLRGYCGMT